VRVESDEGEKEKHADRNERTTVDDRSDLNAFSNHIPIYCIILFCGYQYQYHAISLALKAKLRYGRLDMRNGRFQSGSKTVKRTTTILTPLQHFSPSSL
jgi:hypothetical protein